MIASKDNLTAALERFVNLSILLVQSLSPLLGKGVLVSVTGVVSSQYINRGVKGRETGLSSNLGESSVVGHEVDHLLLQVLSEVLHAVRSLGKAGANNHVGADAGSISFVGVGEAPVSGEFVVF